MFTLEENASQNLFIAPGSVEFTSQLGTTALATVAYTGILDQLGFNEQRAPKVLTIQGMVVFDYVNLIACTASTRWLLMLGCSTAPQTDSPPNLFIMASIGINRYVLLSTVFYSCAEGFNLILVLVVLAVASSVMLLSSRASTLLLLMAFSLTLSTRFKYDSVHRQFKETVEVKDGKLVTVSAECNPTAISWGTASADYVVEATSVFTTTNKASAHYLRPSTNAPIFVCAVNLDKYDPLPRLVIFVCTVHQCQRRERGTRFCGLYDYL
ncbi:hypothetical protein CVT24_002490 [Panaeolus cyanescens]|uniref:Glyceraldehyde 3-phosphate dehydrogenase NAD(P) binding domain-containing protein n=1 Tax=Panaeolus cyanescens TaxID=181874 RepID=A0A409YTN5_9AGAR|nr:hypothetical protein CVT24_002490 [Panaeolus cyanescens]